MSWRGLRRFSGILTDLQTANYELVKLASENDLSKPASKQDLRLAQLCTKMNDAIKDEFLEIANMTTQFTETKFK